MSSRQALLFVWKHCQPIIALTLHRFSSNLHQRDPRSALFSSYDNTAARNASPSPRPSSRPSYNNNNSYGYATPPANAEPAGPAFGAYPGTSSHNSNVNGAGRRSATPRTVEGRTGPVYSDAVLNELESQNDDAVEGMSKKVRMLKDITLAIGDEIRDSTALAEKMNDSFEGTRNRLRGTMTRMLRMAERSG
ncbi:MAG: protein transport protein bet1, partial [Bathelium mastoideum]